MQLKCLNAFILKIRVLPEEEKNITQASEIVRACPQWGEIITWISHVIIFSITLYHSAREFQYLTLSICFSLVEMVPKPNMVQNLSVFSREQSWSIVWRVIKIFENSLTFSIEAYQIFEVIKFVEHLRQEIVVVWFAVLSSSCFIL